MSRILGAVGSLAFIVALLFQGSSGGNPTEEVTASAKELSEQVTIRRDTFGVSHILASTEEAASFGQGYATAEDNVLVMARLFLQARGEEAAHFGPEFARADFAVKHMHMYRGAEEGYPKLAPWAQRILDGYAAGYNHYAHQHRAKLPDWVKPVNGIDILAHARRVILMEFCMDLKQLDKLDGRQAHGPQQGGMLAPAPRALAGNARIGWAGESIAPDDPVRLDEADTHGSNMWALGKSRTVSGKGILLGNPHLAWRGSQTFCEAHITVPGKINISGTTLIGTPGISIGFNENLGWSHTVNLHDSDDVYELTLDPKDEHKYLYDGRSLPMRKETLTIQVKTPSGLETRKRDTYWCHYGPVMKWRGDKAYAFKSASQDEFRFVEQRNLMGKAKNLAEFRRVLDIQSMPMFNICYTDKEGNVFYIFNGRFPDRPRGYDWSGVVAGNTSATEWNHVMPESRLPFLVNPPGGYVQNCNSAPWYTNLRKIIDRRQFPPDLTTNVNGLRQQLSLEMLNGDDKFTLEDVLRKKFNMKLLLAERVKDDLLKHCRAQTVAGESLDEAAEVLQRWDNTASRESKGSLLFVSFWQKYFKKAMTPYATPWDERRPASTPIGIGEPETARKLLADTMKEMKQKYGTLEVAWGDVHRLRRGKLDAPIGGFQSDHGAFRIIQYEEDKDGKFVARGGDSYVLAVEFTSPPTAYSIVAYSQSGDPRSPHHSDQSELFAQEKWKRAWFTEEDIAMNLERAYHP